MRFKTGAILVGSAFLLAGASAALAKSADQHFSGKVKSIDQTEKTLVVSSESGKEQMTFKLASDAKIMQGTTAESLTALKVGERIKVSYLDEGSRHQANRIDLLSGSVAKAKTTHPAKPMPKD